MLEVDGSVYPFIGASAWQTSASVNRCTSVSVVHKCACVRNYCRRARGWLWCERAWVSACVEVMSVPGCACTSVKASGSAIHACDVKYSSERVTRSTFIGASIWTGAKVGALCASVRAFVIIEWVNERVRGGCDDGDGGSGKCVE